MNCKMQLFNYQAFIRNEITSNGPTQWEVEEKQMQTNAAELTEFQTANISNGELADEQVSV